MNAVILNDRELMHLILIAGVTLPYIDEPAAVDLVDDHVDARQQILEHTDFPFFKSLRHDGMIGIGNGLLRNLPCLVPTEPLFIDENAHELCDTERRMGIVDVDGDIIREFLEIAASLDIMAYDALHAGGHHEIFLDQAGLLALVRTVFRVERARDVFHKLTVDCLLTNLLLAKSAVVTKVTFDLRVPKAERVDCFVMITDNRHIVRNAHNDERIFMDELE